MQLAKSGDPLLDWLSTQIGHNTQHQVAPAANAAPGFILIGPPFPRFCTIPLSPWQIRPNTRRLLELSPSPTKLKLPSSCLLSSTGCAPVDTTCSSIPKPRRMQAGYAWSLGRRWASTTSSLSSYWAETAPSFPPLAPSPKP